MSEMTSPRSQDIVFTLYGDYLLGREKPVWVGGLITLLSHFGVSPTAARTVLSRMTQKDWLTADRRGTRSYYGLTRRGRRLLEQGRERIYHPSRPGSWSGTWYLITYSIPESNRPLRDALRVKLQWLGCGLLANGLWITPHDVRAEVREIAVALKISKRLEVFRAEHFGFSKTSDLVTQCWDLAAINRRYAAFLARWNSALDHCATCRLATARQERGVPAVYGGEIPALRHQIARLRKSEVLGPEDLEALRDLERNRDLPHLGAHVVR